MTSEVNKYQSVPCMDYQKSIYLISDESIERLLSFKQTKISQFATI